MKFALSLAAWLALGGVAAADVLVASNAPATNSLATNTPASIIDAAALANAAAVRSFQVKLGFRVNLVAGESLVSQPSAMAFDENGHLFVIERQEGSVLLNRVRLLGDADDNGVFHSSSVYAEDLTNATALACYEGGIFVAASGDILYLKDTKGVGAADAQRTVFKTFGDSTNGLNGQVVITSLAWGLDNRIHASIAGHGGDVVSGNSPTQSLILTDGNFAFDPRTSLLMVESGSGAAICFDAGGHEFALSLAGHLRAIMYDARYATRNPYYTMPPAMRELEENIANNQTQPGQSAFGGLMIYQGNAFSTEYWGNAFIVDSAQNKVNRRILHQQGEQLLADSPGDETQFLGVGSRALELMQAVTAPDGTLYLALRNRGGIKLNIAGNSNAAPAIAQSQTGIFRVSPANFKPLKLPQLAKATSEQLAQVLRHPNGWQREMAARLLYERQDRAAIIPLISLLFDAQVSSLARMRALWALDGLQITAEGRPGRALMEPHVLKGMNDPDDRVREQAVLLAERFITIAGAVSDRVWGGLSERAEDSTWLVRYQLAFTLGQIRRDGRNQLLSQIVLGDPGNRRLQSAALSSLHEGSGEVFSLTAANANFRASANGEEFLSELVTIAGSKNDPSEITPILPALAAIPEARIAFSVALAFDNALQQSDNSLAAVDAGRVLNPLYSRARTLAVDTMTDDATRGQALRLLSSWLGDAEPEPSVTSTLVAQWASLTPAMQNAGLSFILSRPQRTALLVTALPRTSIQANNFNSVQMRFLTAHPDASIRQIIGNYFQLSTPAMRQTVVNNYLPALQLAGNAERGREIFTARCAVCHEFADEGNALRLPLPDETPADKEKVLIKILDPNRVTPQQHPESLVTTTGGETLRGFVVKDGPKSLALCDGSGDVRVIGHSQVASVNNLGYSAMIEGLENALNRQDMADLLGFVCGPDPKTQP